MFREDHINLMLQFISEATKNNAIDIEYKIISEHYNLKGDYTRYLNVLSFEYDNIKIEVAYEKNDLIYFKFDNDLYVDCDEWLNSNLDAYKLPKYNLYTSLLYKCEYINIDLNYLFKTLHLLSTIHQSCSR